ncbi:hypothetical protein ACFXO2_43810 [Streptomyces sp. NPDC059152]|uniref:hypothetical protein n=1 Tax=Streptomyces sp. NPDC059152 TaxID=3346742 RepID=UPI0036836251
MTDALPTRREGGSEYLSCEWCGEAVDQIGTRTPRRYCKRSHRQRAFEARKHGEPMRRLRGEPAVVEEHVQEELPIPAAPVEEKEVPFVKERRKQPRRAMDIFAGMPRHPGIGG